MSEHCGGKKRYPTYRAAENVVRQMRRSEVKGARHADRLRAYLCDECRNFHVGRVTIAGRLPGPKRYDKKAEHRRERRRHNNNEARRD